MTALTVLLLFIAIIVFAVPATARVRMVVALGTLLSVVGGLVVICTT